MAGKETTWTEDELRAAVHAYLDMQAQTASGTPLNKAAMFKALSARFPNRTPKAFEYRMQNISAVLALSNQKWLKGFAPAKNVGANIAKQIGQLLSEQDGRRHTPPATGDVSRRSAQKEAPPSKPVGTLVPEQITQSSEGFRRDEEVVLWVLRRANGKCECCGKQAPFNDANGRPFLEVHHVRRLADGGSDTVQNAVGICPNCHRELHYGERAKSLALRLYDLVTELIPEGEGLSIQQRKP